MDDMFHQETGLDDADDEDDGDGESSSVYVFPFPFLSSRFSSYLARRGSAIIGGRGG